MAVKWRSAGERSTGSRLRMGGASPNRTRTATIPVASRVERRPHVNAGISLGGILVIIGIVVAVFWSVVLGVIIALVGLIAFGGFARGRWY